MSNLTDLLPAGGGGKNVNFVASGTLPSGQAVILQSDGTAKAISQTTISNSVGSATQAATDTGEDYSVVSIGSSKVMFLFEGTSAYVKAVVGTISGTSISFGTVFVVNSSTSESIRGAYDSINDKVVVVYGKSYGSNPGYSKVLTVSGTSISSGSEVTFSGSTNVSGISMAPVFDPDTGKIAVVYWEYGGGDPLKVSIGAVSGTSISYTPGNQFATGGRYVDAVYDTAANAFAIIYSDVSNNLRVIAATLSGTTMTFGSALDLYTGASAQNSYPSIGYDASASAFVAVYADETNNKYGTARVGTISGTTITLGSATLVSGNQSFTSNRLFGVVYNAATQTTVVIWGDRPSNNILYSSIGTVSGTSISFATKFLLSNDGIQQYGAAYSAASEKIAIMVRPGANDIDGFVYTSAGVTTNLTATNFIGIADADIANAASGSVTIKGGISTIKGGTYTITVVNSGSGNKYAINGVEVAVLNLYEGATYKFDQSSGTNSGHPFRFSTTADGTHGGGNEYTTGVTTSGTPGNAGAYTQIIVASGAPTLYYYCSVHSGMGGTANTLAIVPNSNYYVQNDGTLTTTTSTVLAGRALSSTSINLDYTT